jgi:signal transduction histidine kinase/ligand-binding sensor domain-containing protein
MKSTPQSPRIIGLGLLILGLCLCSTPLSIYAQTASGEFRHFSIRDGLNNTFVWYMLQDRNGFIWTVGNGGADRFDGQNFVNFNHNPQNPNSLPTGEGRAILEDNDGLIWVVTAQGVAILNPATDEINRVSVSQNPSDKWSLYKDKNGDVWVGSNEGLHHIPRQDWHSGAIEVNVYPIAEQISPFNGIRSIAPKGDSQLWIGTNSGVQIFDLETGTFERIGPYEGELNAMMTAPIWKVFTDSRQNLWISSNLGFALWRNGDDTPELLNTFPNSDINLQRRLVQSIVEDDQGLIYVGTGQNGAFILNPETMEITRFQVETGNVNSIADDDVHFFFKDNEGIYWFAYHFNGISLMYSESWKYEFSRVEDTAPLGSPMSAINAVVSDTKNNIWFATEAGVYMKPADGSALRQLTSGAQNAAQEAAITFMKLVGDRIFASASHTVFVIDPSRGTMEKLDLPEELFPVFSMNSDGSYVYFSTELDDGLFFLDINDFSYRMFPHPLEDRDEVTSFMDVLVDGQGTAWAIMATFTQNAHQWSIYEFDPVEGKVGDEVLRNPGQLLIRGLPVHSQTEPGVFWTPTDRGLLRQDLYARENRFYLQESVWVSLMFRFDLITDNDGYVWIGGIDGLRRFDPITSNLSYFRLEGNRRPSTFNVMLQLSDGTMIAGGPGGYIRFNPQDLVEDAPLKFVHITQVRAGSEVFSPMHKPGLAPRFDHTSNSLTFSFTGLNYVSPQSTRYRYRLKGYQDEWLDIGSQSQVFIANLSPGSYTFQVQARSLGGTFGDVFAEAHFTILPPWWRTVPAYIAFLLMFALLVVGVDRVQRRRLMARAREKSREKELQHAREIQVAYDNLKAAQDQLVQQEKLASLGQLTAGIAHEIKNPLNFVNNFAELSIELIDELNEDYDTLSPELQEQIERLADSDNSTFNIQNSKLSLADIKTNLRKIHEHGSRADSIVKSMLLHSRGGSGALEPTDLNGLVREYVNLAFHGMRASKNPFNVDIRLQLDETVGQVPLIAEDFSRVILNLCNNAFDAMREKGEGTKEKREAVAARLSVRTKRDGSSVAIKIEDNGPGIPEEIKDKILQPFFTTKKGTAGTGLGLSITNDIIKAHGGTLSIESKSGEGSSFIITLSS